MYFYNPLPLGETERSCLPCAGGYFCDAIQIGSLAGYECSDGYYCPEGTQEEIPCPPGTYRVAAFGSSLGVTVADCDICPDSYYCPGVIDPDEPTEFPVPCTDGEYCPSGSGKPSLCEAGRFCENTVPSATFSNNVILVQPCDVGFYCEQGTTTETPCNDPLLCPYISVTDGNKFEGGQSVSCPAGYYLSGTYCKYCNKGFVCLPGSLSATPTESSGLGWGYECPVGHYCDPELSVFEIKCPKGTYRNEIKGKSVEDCLKCPENTYNKEEGQALCQSCGTGATSLEGQSYCEAIGKYRIWMNSTGYTECMKGYERN